MTDAIPPEGGKLAKVRGKYWLIDDVSHADDVVGTPSTLVTLESLDDTDLGSKTSVILEREVDFQVLPDKPLPDVGNTLDTPVVFDSFVNALRWTNKSILGGDLIRAPFYGAIKQQSFQLEPVIRALSMPRISLLIADDVGLGKTVEAGMIIQEMILRGKARRILLVCPASLQLQWKWEMEHKFGLDFKIVDSQKITEFKREYGVNVNPWLAYPRIITSMDFIKMEGRKTEFLRSCEVNSSKYIRSWDLLVVDEAHNAMPKPTKKHYRDSERTKMLNDIGRHFEHKIFMTATPHNGCKESFVAFLDMLDPLSFNRGEDPEANRDSFRKRLERTMVRRLKRGPNCVKDDLGRPLFPKREITSIDIDPSKDEQESIRLLNKYILERVQAFSDNGDRNRPLEFALTILKKRLLSSPRAFYNSINVHTEHMRDKDSSDKYKQLLLSRLDEDWDNDLEKEQTEQELLSATQADQIGAYLKSLSEIASRQKDRPDTKVKTIVDWIDSNLKKGNTWNDERVVIFTEFKDTMEYLTDQLKAHGIESERIIQLFGGMVMKKREEIKAAFELNPDESPARILVATDAASEGINLQHNCRYMIHMEIPWSPIRLEQRNGRIDRHGQTRDVYVYHFVYGNDEDSCFLKTIVKKVEQIREDIGSVNPIIAERIQRKMLHQEHLDEKMLDDLKDMLTSELLNVRTEAANLAERIAQSREELRLTPGAVKELLDSALKLNGSPGLKHLDDDLHIIEQLPDNWKELRSYTTAEGRPRMLTFKPSSSGKIQHLHPNHPLVKKAIAYFRSNIWSRALDGSKKHRLNKITCKVIPEERLGQPHVLFYVRALAVNRHSQPLVEEVDIIGGRFDQGRYLHSEKDYLESLDREAVFKKEASDLVQHLSKTVKLNEGLILDHVKDYTDKWKAKLKRELEEATSSEIQSLRSMIIERTKEIDKALKVLDRYAGTMFEDQLQYSEDIRLLRNRREYLKSQLQEIPKKVKEKYSLKGNPLVTVVGICFLVPEEMLS